MYSWDKIGKVYWLPCLLKTQCFWCCLQELVTATWTLLCWDPITSDVFQSFHWVAVRSAIKFGLYCTITEALGDAGDPFWSLFLNKLVKDILYGSSQSVWLGLKLQDHTNIPVPVDHQFPCYLSVNPKEISPFYFAHSVISLDPYFIQPIKYMELLPFPLTVTLHLESLLRGPT